MNCPACGKPLSTERGMRRHHAKVHGEPLPNRTCADCGTEFCDAKSRRTYCDDCYSETGEKNGNDADAKEATECEQCGDTVDDYPQGAHTVENLIALCKSCHMYAEHGNMELRPPS